MWQEEDRHQAEYKFEEKTPKLKLTTKYFIEVQRKALNTKGKISYKQEK